MTQQKTDYVEKQGALSLIAKEIDHGKRLDCFVAEYCDECPRTMASDLIKAGHISVNSSFKKPSYNIKSGDRVEGNIPPESPVSFEAEPIDLNILYEDSDLLVINKQPGLVVHPAPGNWSGTLVNGLLNHCPSIQDGNESGRPGIVHRLDKNTSGVMVVAKNRKTLFALAESFKSRDVKKEYLALVHGVVIRERGIIDLPVGRHPVDRKRMSTVSSRGRSAETHFTVVKKFNNSSLLNCEIKTGRTHQIRVHMESMGHPIVGDDLYNHYKGFKKSKTGPLSEATRQMLHSAFLEIIHPTHHERMSFSAPMYPDMSDLISRLESTANNSESR